MKIKRILIIITAISLILLLAQASKNNHTLKNKAATSSSQKEDLSKNIISAKPKPPTLPVAFEDAPGNPFNARETLPTPNKPSLKQLAGPVHNEFGIRDDIYAYIKKSVPASNTMAMKAALTYAAQTQFIYYKATEDEVVEASKKMFISLRCLRKSKHSKDPIAVTEIIDNMMKNTKDREDHMWEIAERLFSWKILGPRNMTNADIEKVCVSGEY